MSECNIRLRVWTSKSPSALIALTFLVTGFSLQPNTCEAIRRLDAVLILMLR